MPSARPRPHPARRVARERSRDDIVGAATRLFATHGLENVTFGAISKAARVSRPLVYFYFPTQEQLFLECALRASAELHRRFVAAVQPEADGLDRLEAVGRAYLGLHQDDPAAFQMIAQFHGKPPASGAARELFTRVETIHAAIDDLTRSLLLQGLRDGSIRRGIGDAQQVSVCLWGFCQGLVQLVAMKGESPCLQGSLDVAQAVETGFALLRAGLAGTAPRRKGR